MSYDSNTDQQVPLLKSSLAPAHLTLSFTHAFLTMLRKSGFTLLSYTISFRFITTTIMFTQLREKDVNTSSAATMVNAIEYFVAVNALCAVAPITLYLLERMPEYERLKAIENRSEEEEESLKEVTEDIARLWKNTFVIAMIPAVLVLLCFWLMKPAMLVLFKSNEADADFAVDYLSIAIWEVIAFGFRLAFEKILWIFGKQALVASVAFPTFVVGVGLQAILGFPCKLGAVGLAIGSLIEAYAEVGFFHTCLQTLGIPFLNMSFYDARDAQQILAIGKKAISYMFLPMLAENISLFLINMFAGRLGTDELAAQNFASQVFFFYYLASLAIADSAQSFVPSFLRNNQTEIAITHIYAGIAQVLLIPGVCFTLPLVIRPQLMQYLIPAHVDQRVVELAAPAVRIATTTAFFMALSNVMYQIIIGAQAHAKIQSLSPVFTIVAAFLFGAGLAGVWGLVFQGGLVGDLGGFGLCVAMGTVLMAAQLYHLICSLQNKPSCFGNRYNHFVAPNKGNQEDDEELNASFVAPTTSTTSMRV